jgi:phosphoglycerate dehydrogenase-like enzyme
VKALYQKGVNSFYVAEHTLTLILNLLRRVSVSDRQMRVGQWRRNGGVSLARKTVGIIGLGHVGSQLAQLLRGFDCTVLYNDIEDRVEASASFDGQACEVDELLARADVVSMHVPLTSLTEGMCDVGFFGRMQPEAIYINTSRGKVCDIDALSASLQSGTIAGAACDVFPEEPYSNGDILQYDSFIATPHIAANCQEAKKAMACSALDLIIGQRGQ